MIQKVIVPYVLNGKEPLSWPAKIQIDFIDANQVRQYTIECDEKGGEFAVPMCERFAYHDVEGKVWALDRTVDSGRYFTMCNSGWKIDDEYQQNNLHIIQNNDKAEPPKELTLQIRLCGPFPVFGCRPQTRPLKKQKNKISFDDMIFFYLRIGQ